MAIHVGNSYVIFSKSQLLGVRLCELVGGWVAKAKLELHPVIDEHTDESDW
jgi:hypothetical protein